MKTKLGIKILFGILIFCIIILTLVFFAGFNNLIVKPLITNEEPQKSDVVIVLGGGVDKDIKDIGKTVQKRVDNDKNAKSNKHQEESCCNFGKINFNPNIWNHIRTD